MSADWIDVGLLTIFFVGAFGALVALTLLIVAAVKGR